MKDKRRALRARAGGLKARRDYVAPVVVYHRDGSREIRSAAHIETKGAKGWRRGL